MLGAIVGDIIGSVFEQTGTKTEDFPLFSEDSTFTDDTVQTCAVAKWLLDDEKRSPSSLVTIMQSLCKKHRWRGYSFQFSRWIKNPIPYNSYGNGSAMRVSPCGIVATKLEEAQWLAEISASISHNHPEGIKGAVAVSSAIYLNKNGESKEYIKKYISDNFYSIPSLDAVRDSYKFDATCQGSVPHALAAFYEGQTLEEVIRLSVSLGGDSDTIAAIASSIASVGDMKVEDSLSKECESRLTEDLLDIVRQFENKYHV